MPASPLHASFPENRRSNESQDGAQQTPAKFPTSPRSPRGGASGSRQTRRLQLRNAGFRGANINTARNATPPSALLPSISTSTNWSSVSGFQQSSDAENVSPSGRRAGDDTTGSVREDSSAGILQEIGNSGTLRRRARGRVTSSKFWSADNSNKRESLLSDDFQSPPPSTASGAYSGSIRQRSVRTRAKMPRTNRSASGETRKYVEHLEAQLSEAQSQLSAMNSPTVTREQSSKMRHLNAETRQLQDEVAAWEARYEERVQEELDKHYHLESTLRTRVRALEQEVEEKHFRVSELEMQLENATQTMDAAEKANVNLEKRLEIMSELLAASPTKIDLHAETPGRARQGRPHSMIIPRFPTVSSLATSPELRSQASPMSPTSSIARLSSPKPMASPTNLTFSPEVASSDDDESIHSDMISVVSGPPPAQKQRPIRRMRRFGAGSIGPKPLILPSTSHCEQIAFSAPPLELKEGESVFPFPPRIEEETTGSPVVSRRRASSEAVQQQVVQPSTSTFMSFASIDGDENDRRSSVLHLSPPQSRLSLTRDLDSMDSRLHAAVGRNLMEELTAVRSGDSDSGEELPMDAKSDGRDEDGIPNSSPFNSDVEEERLAQIKPNNKASPTSPAGSGLIPDASSALAAPSVSRTVIHRRMTSNSKSHSRSSSRSSISTAKSKISISSMDSLRSILSNMFRSPVELAKHLVQTAQSRMSIPRPLLTVQWWLVGILLGPMARRRMLGRSTANCCDKKSKSPDKQPLLDEGSPTNEEGDPIAYRTAYQTPESTTSSPVRARSLVAGKGKKRAASISSGGKTPGSPSSPCPHQLAIQKRWKHSPFLWLKFSMTLAIAVGVAFRDGPSSLLKEAVCRCKAKEREEGKKRGGGHGRKLSNSAWRKSSNRRDDVLVTPGS